MKILVAGGSGFIGSALIHLLIAETEHGVVNLDKLTYAANPLSLAEIEGHPRYVFVHQDICDGDAVARVLAENSPDAVINLAAESHVDRSIDDPAPFLVTNVIGTTVLLTAACAYWRNLGAARRESFRFLQVSTDEVYGDLAAGTKATEDDAYAPGSPYAASKAAADHLALAWHRTYGLPVMLSNCTNNYGPRQFPEKLIPLTILNALAGEPLPIYGDGRQVRDWLHVEDHARALMAVLTKGVPGRKYNVSADAERENIEVVGAICRLLDEAVDEAPHARLITHVTDRPGHDRRYALDAGRIGEELGWRPRESFAGGLAKTVQWYLHNRDWWRPLREGVYGGERLGLDPDGRKSARRPR